MLHWIIDHFKGSIAAAQRATERHGAYSSAA
jgi:hypothetical protein